MAAHLTYFSVRALGEPIRMLLSYGKIPFTEEKYTRLSDEWFAVKKDYPMGQLPLLKIDGYEIHQSKAICRYIAKKIHLDGENDLDRIKIDIASDVVYDFIMKLRIPREFEDPVANAAKLKSFQTTVLPFYLESMDKMVQDNGGTFVNGKLTWVDFYFAAPHQYYNFLAHFNVLEGYDNLKTLVEKIHSLPQLQQYLKNRETTEF